MRKILSWAPWFAGLLLGGLLIANQCSDIGNFLEDDPLISLRYSERLLDGKGLTWTDGERVEGYSNLSQVLIVAALAATGVDLITALRVFCVGSMALAFVFLMLFARRVGAGWLSSMMVLVLLGSTAPMAIWTIAGLEQPFVLACLAASLWCLLEFDRSGFLERRWAVRAGIALAMLVWTRPDSPLFVAGIAAGIVLIAGRRRLGQLPRALVWVVGLPFAAWAAQLIFRLAYYGEWVPNTAFVKAHVTTERVQIGLDYVKTGVANNPLLLGFVALGALLAVLVRETRRWSLMILGLLVGWLAYVAAVGGDHFPGWRHLVPAWGLAALVVLLGIAGLKTRWPGWALLRPVPMIAALAMVPWSLKYQWNNWQNGVTRVARWQWEGETVGLMFGRAFKKEQPLYAVTAAGCLPFFSKLPALDMLGLNDKHIARQPADPRMPVGHDHGDGKYVLRRGPDLITFNMPRGNYPGYTGGEQMAAEPSFARDYTRIPFQALEPLAMTSESYVRWVGRIGLRTEPSGALVVPAYLFREARGIPLPDDGGMGAILRGGRSASLHLEELEGGRWQVELVPPNPRVSLVVRAAQGVSDQIVTTAPGGVTMSRTAPLDIELSSSDTTVVGQIKFTRLPEGAMARMPEPVPEAHGYRRNFGADETYRNWRATGDAFSDGLANGARIGQTPTSGAQGAFFNSFRDNTRTKTGDSYRGVLTSPVFSAAPSSRLSFSVGGGLAEGFESQVGVRVVELSSNGERHVRFVATGERDEVLRPVTLDLGWLAGRQLFIEVFDDAEGGWGHVLAGDFILND